MIENLKNKHYEAWSKVVESLEKRAVWDPDIYDTKSNIVNEIADKLPIFHCFACSIHSNDGRFPICRTCPLHTSMYTGEDAEGFMCPNWEALLDSEDLDEQIEISKYIRDVFIEEI